jgi:cysteine-rich repeat protein
MTAQPTATVTPTPTLTPTLTATPTVTPTPTGPVCGDGTKDAGEDCDDGNTSNCDSCPADCSFAVAACPTGTESQTVSVRVTPQFSGITGADLCLSYPDGTVQIPGTGLVSGRTTFNGLLFLNDSDVAAQLSASTTTVMSTLDMTVRFDLCMGSAPAPLGLFHCQIRNASDDFNQLIPLTDVSCQVQ